MTFDFRIVALKQRTILLLISSFKTDTTNTFYRKVSNDWGKKKFLTYHSMSQFIDSVPMIFLCKTDHA